MGRVVDAGRLFFYLQDIVDHPEFRGKSIGRTLIKLPMDQIYSTRPKA